ncbi:P-loop containing nucleoside triphosphate hydrolase protein [Chytridium lagenaria]|nr:P-loop containing nucleoside triphosphate hydrolase protein [Chytridium lagenaria]
MAFERKRKRSGEFSAGSSPVRLTDAEGSDELMEMFRQRAVPEIQSIVDDVLLTNGGSSLESMGLELTPELPPPPNDDVGKILESTAMTSVNVCASNGEIQQSKELNEQMEETEASTSSAMSSSESSDYENSSSSSDAEGEAPDEAPPEEPPPGPRQSISIRIPVPVSVRSQMFASRLQQILSASVWIDDEEIPPEVAIEKAKKDARSGYLTGQTIESLRPRSDPQIRKSHQTVILEEMKGSAAGVAAVRKYKISSAKRISKAVLKYWELKRTEGDRHVKSEAVRLRKMAKFVAQEVFKKWKVIDSIVQAKRKAIYDEEQKRAGKRHLDSIIEKSTHILEAQQSIMAEQSQMDLFEEQSEASFMSQDHEVEDEKDMPLEELLKRYGYIDRPQNGIDTPADSASEASNLNDRSRGDEIDEGFDDQGSDVAYGVDSDDGVTEEYHGLGTALLSLGPLEPLESADDISYDLSGRETSAAPSDTTSLDTDDLETGRLELEELLHDSELEISDLLPPPEETYVDDYFASALEASDHETDDESEISSDDENDIAGSALVEKPVVETPEELMEEEDQRDLLSRMMRAIFRFRTIPTRRLLKSRSLPLRWGGMRTMKLLLRPKFHFSSNIPFENINMLDWIGSLTWSGKTIQTIALIAYLAVEKAVWGPHLIVVPTSVMLNWEVEFKKWCPGLKILTYYGNPNQRKEKRTGWSKPNAFHVCITSYQLVLADQVSFRRKPWIYLVLDEAHNIKNFRSQKWQVLLTFNSQRRLLLTGTPLQNNLMGVVVTAEFQEWFSRPVDKVLDESKASEVEKQMPKKYEHVLTCRLSTRQRYLYDDFMSRAKTKEALASGNYLSIINCLMQLRKVCNHPDLFEERPVPSSHAVLIDSHAGDHHWLTSSRDKLHMVDLGEGQSAIHLKDLPYLVPHRDFDRQVFTAAQSEYRLRSLIDPSARPGSVRAFKAAYDLRRASEVTVRWCRMQILNRFQLEMVRDVVDRFAFVTPKVVVKDAGALVEELEVEKAVGQVDDIYSGVKTKLSIAFPDKWLVRYDCGKLQKLDALLRRLLSGGHRALIFTQMTRMLDILERFLNVHGYLYVRLDGSTKIEQRQMLMERCGMNLTGADTVIFYDSDWNPAMDAQAQDRAHRIGQTRDVHITVSLANTRLRKNMLRKANQKRRLDSLIIQRVNSPLDFLRKRVDWKDWLDGMGIDVVPEEVVEETEC